jgi:prophage regulatory protein
MNIASTLPQSSAASFVSESASCPNKSSRLLRLPSLIERISLSRSEIYRRVRNDPSFPKPTVLGIRCVAWVEEEVDAYIRDQIAQRDAKALSA